MKTTLRALAALLFCCCLFLFDARLAIGQTITGSVRGTVTDPTGAVISNAKVTATNVETGVATGSSTDTSGLYHVQFLSIGNYTITTTAGGFNTATVGPFKLEIDQIAKIDVKM